MTAAHATTNRTTGGTDTMNTITATIEAQGVLQPGDAGWWKVWGATPRNVRAGDAVLLDPAGDFEIVDETFTAKAAPMRVGLVLAGERCTIGALCPIIVLRQGTHNTLA